MVSNTYTLNDWFGAGVTAHGTGVLLNNEMDDFTVQSRRRRTSIGLIQSDDERDRAAQAAALVDDAADRARHGKPWLAVGAAGGPRIISAVLQVIVNIVDFNMNLQEALDAGAHPSSVAAGRDLLGAGRDESRHARRARTDGT